MKFNELAEKSELVIVLPDANSVPIVFLNGEEVEYKKYVGFNWRTSDEQDSGSMNYIINHFSEADQTHVVVSKERKPKPYTSKE